MPECTARAAPIPRYLYPKLAFSECYEERGLQDDLFCQVPAGLFQKKIIRKLICLGMPVLCQAEKCQTGGASATPRSLVPGGGGAVC